MNSQLMEISNGIIFAIDVGIASILARYLYDEMKKHGYSRVRSRGALSLLIIFLGDALNSGVLWWVNMLVNDGIPPDFVTENKEVIVMAGTIMLILGGLFYISVWSPADEGHWPWVGTAIVGTTLAFGGLIPALTVWAILFAVFYLSRRNTEENP